MYLAPNPQLQGHSYIDKHWEYFALVGKGRDFRLPEYQNSNCFAPRFKVCELKK